MSVRYFEELEIWKEARRLLIGYIQRSGMRGRKFNVSSPLAKTTRIVKLEPRSPRSPTD